MRCPLIALTSIALAVPGSVRADPRAEAASHVERARTLHADGQLAEAQIALKTAYALDPQPELLFAMGQIHVQLGECAQAITFYERFLATRPGRGEAIAAEAIATCKTAPPPPAPRPAQAPKPRPSPRRAVDLPPPVAPTPMPALVAPPLAVRPWYANYVADGLVATGVVSGVAALLVFRSARADRDRADLITGYDAYVDQIDRAETKQTTSVVLGAASVVLITAGGLHFLLSDRAARTTGVAIAPHGQGGLIAWSGRF